MSVVPAIAASRSVVAAHAILRGHVQGLGVRPAIANLAARCRLTGSVGNVTGGVAITIEGDSHDVATFQNKLLDALPREALVEDCAWTEAVGQGCVSFTIRRSSASEQLATPVPIDRAVCKDCLCETLDRQSRRHNYAFTSCTKCGPRFSIITSMPYERSATTMESFPLCALCAREDADPADRRYHAQTNACPDCGPKLWSRDRHGLVTNDQACVLDQAVSAILSGHLVALRGIGGYQLLCDATNGDAVRRLRVAKRRPDKPFAVLVSGSIALEHWADATDPEWNAVTAPGNPITLRSTPPDLALSPEVSRGLSTVGLMLPTTPLHALLATRCNVPLVVTSGNVEGDPLDVDVAEAECSLGEIADLFLHHNRPIAHPLDDSVIRVIADHPVTFRLARGAAPFSLPVTSSIPGLALGGHQKAAIALSNGPAAILGPHIGDLDSLSMRARFETHVDEMLELYGCSPEFIVIDQHPDYFTSRWAQQWNGARIEVAESGLREEPGTSAVAASGSPSFRLAKVRHVVRVQHHHAHIAAAMLDRGWHDREVLGVAFDGTGYGPDGTIWGGEFLLCTLAGFRRVGRLRPFALPGGELAIRQPWRVAISLLAEILTPSDLQAACQRLLPKNVGWEAVLGWQSNHRLAPLTTSAGRLFDGIAALVLQIHEATFEGQPAMLLEDCCRPRENHCYEFPVHTGELFELDWRPAVESVIRDLTAGEPPDRIATRFHHGLAAGIARVCENFQQHPVVLGGGVFQNRTLVEAIADLFPTNRMGLPGRIPPNDGGLAAGQLAIASRVVSSLQNN